MIPEYHNWYEKPIHIWFSLVWESFWIVIAEKQHFGHFGTQNGDFSVQGLTIFILLYENDIRVS